MASSSTIMAREQLTANAKPGQPATTLTELVNKSMNSSKPATIGNTKKGTTPSNPPETNISLHSNGMPILPGSTEWSISNTILLASQLLKLRNDLQNKVALPMKSSTSSSSSTSASHKNGMEATRVDQDIILADALPSSSNFSSLHREVVVAPQQASSDNDLKPQGEGLFIKNACIVIYLLEVITIRNWTFNFSSNYICTLNIRKLLLKWLDGKTDNMCMIVSIC